MLGNVDSDHRRERHGGVLRFGHAVEAARRQLDDPSAAHAARGNGQPFAVVVAEGAELQLHSGERETHRTVALRRRRLPEPQSLFLAADRQRAGEIVAEHGEQAELVALVGTRTFGEIGAQPPFRQKVGEKGGQAPELRAPGSARLTVPVEHALAERRAPGIGEVLFVEREARDAARGEADRAGEPAVQKHAEHCG